MAPKNRIEELQQEMDKNEQPKKKKKNKSTVIELEEGNTFQNFEVIRKWIDSLEESTKKCEENYKANPNSKGLHKKLREAFKSTETTVYNIASSLKKINVTLNNSTDKSSADFRMKLIQYTGLVSRFKQVVAEQEALIEKIFVQERNFVQKCYQIVNESDLDDAQLNQLIDENPNIFTQDYIQNEIEARRQLADLETRHQCLLAIEEHLTEIKDLFITIATSVELQQESLDRIEHFAAGATDYVDKAVVELDSAKKARKRSRKIKIIILIVVIILIVIILASIFG